MESARVYPRLPVLLEAEFRLAPESDWRTASILNLSAGGALLFSDEELPTLATLSPLRFSLPGAGDESMMLIVIQALVLRSVPSTGQTDRRGYLSGLQFLDLRGEPFERVRHFVFETIQKRRSGGA